MIEAVPISHEDDRRTIIEYYDRKEGEPAFANQKIIRIKEAQNQQVMRLGNHYHQDWELFYLVQGEIDELILEDIKTQERMVEREIAEGTKILLPPNVAHLLIFRRPSLLIASNENPFNVDNLKPYDLKSKSFF